MSFPYKKIAVFGATSGIGWALAERFIENNIFVIALGRRKERLAELVQKHGHDKVQACPCDLMAMDSIPNLVINLTSTHPDLDLVFLNSGVQYGHDFTKPESVSLEHIQSEFTLNYISQIAVTKAFLPFLLSRAKEGKHAGLMYTSSGLSMVPIPTVPNYCATKAALHSFLMTLRIQLRDTGVKVIEIFPPAVQTELHGEHGKNVGMPVSISPN